MPRPKTPKLTRAAIAAAAIEHVEAGRELQLVPIAKRLNVSVSSLYHHVDGRNDIVHAMRELLTESYWLEIPAGTPWPEAVRQAATVLRDLYGNHPRTTPLLLSVEVASPATLAFYSELMISLLDGGIPVESVVTVVEMVDAYVLGVALDAMSPSSLFDLENLPARVRPLFAAHPTGKRRNDELFEFGLKILIEGIRRLTTSASV